MTEPWMSGQDREIVLQQLLRQETLDVLEWGAGGSTVWFPSRLRAVQRAFRWRSVEHNGWFFRRRLGQAFVEVAPNLFELKGWSTVQVQLYDCGPRRSVWKHPELAAKYDAYINQEGAFSVILVDGRMRRRCLLRAAQLLRPGGVVMLHDAARRRYHCAFGAYRGGFVGDALWMGRCLRETDA